MAVEGRLRLRSAPPTTAVATAIAQFHRFPVDPSL
jgi:hypothetical protein